MPCEVKHEKMCCYTTKREKTQKVETLAHSENEREQESITQMRRAWMKVLEPGNPPQLSLGKQWLMPVVVIGKVSLRRGI